MKRIRASAVCVAEGHVLLVRLRDPSTGVEGVYPPGGGIEEGEEPSEAARREALEETGLRVRVASDLAVVDSYPFRWDEVDYEVTTHYFAAELEGAFTHSLPPVNDATYNLGAAWLPVDEALEAMSIHPRIATAVARVIRLAERADWRAHRHIAGPAGTLLAIHGQFRAASERVALLVARESDLGWVGRAFSQLSQTLHHHHHAEEALLFPFMERRTGTAPERLVDDHRELTRAIEAVEVALTTHADRARAIDAVSVFAEVLATHLDREESLVIPVLLELSPADGWAMVHGG